MDYSLSQGVAIGGLMPRLPSDKTVTHRIELGIPERAKLDDIIKTQKENQRIDGVTQTLQAVGTGLAGGGVIFAAAALAAWLAPGLIKSATDKAKNAVDEYFSKIANPIAEKVVTERQEAYYQAARNVTEAKQYQRVVCDPNSINYDSAQCIIASNNLDALEKVRAEKQQDLTSMNIDDAKEAAYSELEKLPFGKVLTFGLDIIY